MLKAVRELAVQQVARRSFESRVTWILGSPRSGSSWLLHLLADTGTVVPVDEPLIGLYLSPFLSDTPGWHADQLDAETFTLRRVQRDKTDQFFAREFEAAWREPLRDLMLDRFFAHAVEHRAWGSLREMSVVIKEPNGSQSADIILSTLPRSRVLFLLRDGRDVVDSELAANSKGSWVSRQFPGGGGVDESTRLAFVEQSAHKWLWRTEVTQEAFAAHTGPKHMVRYEDLRRDQPTYLREIVDWLDLDVDDDRLADLIAKHSFEGIPASERGPDQFARAATAGLWRENMTAHEQQAMHRIMGPKLAELGYGGT
jgi:hypothetical protein